MSVDMRRSNVQALYELLDHSAEIISEVLDIPYIEGVVQTGENLFNNNIHQELDEEKINSLKELYQSVSLEEMEKEDIRKGFQLAILKGLKDSVQPHHVMTPDAVALFISYLVNKAVEAQETTERLKVLDPGVGSGNLLSAILNHTAKVDKSYGIDIDETLINLAYVSMNLQRHTIQLFRQDALNPLLAEPIDIVVSDLPVGYYPNDIQAKEYELAAKEGHSFAHHLYIEQSLRYAKEGGLLFFLIPNHLFSNQAEQLHTFLKETTYIHGLLQLPQTMFKSESNAKSILFLQKKGGSAAPSKDTLLVNLPSFSKQESLSKMIAQIENWFKTSYKKHTS
jgi:site-specific DNA-methyltransferase (adenine-specific)